jgi:putative PIN family toxin of toxin-antitoxin system
VHKPRVILDSSVVVSGIGWRTGDARKVLKLLAARGFQSYRTQWLTDEWVETVQFVAEHEPRWRNPRWPNWLDWLKRASKFQDDIPVRKTVKRDPKDDPVVMAAVAARAAFLVTNDDDLLALEKPYGIACVTPRQFLAAVLRQR